MDRFRTTVCRYPAAGRAVGSAGLAVAILVPLCGCASWETSRVKPGNTTGPRFVIQSHRGAGKLAPENTIEAFELAWSIGSVPEADVRTTKDGECVAFHDANFKRLVKDAPADLQAKSIGDLAWAEITKLDVGSWMGSEFAGQRVPRIRDVFGIMRDRPERWLYLDVKDVALDQLADLARRQGVSRQVILASTHHDQVAKWKELLPDSQTLLWMGEPEAKLAERFRLLRESDFKGVTQLQIHVQVGDLNADEPFRPSSAFLRAVGVELRQREILFQVLPRGRDDSPVYGRFMDLGVESFATDDPRAALQAVSDYHSRGRK